MAHNVNAMLPPQPQQQHKQHLPQRQQYDVSDLGHDFVSTLPIEHGRVGLGGHVGYFQEQHNDPPSPPQHELDSDRHNSSRPWLPLGLQTRDLPRQKQHHLNRYEMDEFHPQPVRSIAHMYGDQEVGPTEQYQIWAQGQSRTRERILPSQEELQDDDYCLPGTILQPSQGTHHTSSRQCEQEQEDEDQAQEMGMNDPSAHQSCIETLSQLEQDLAEMQSRYDALQQECENLRRSNEQMVMDHVQEKRAKTYHDESIQRRKEKESKRLSTLHDQLRQVLESNKQFRAKVRALERGQIEAEREQREELVSLTGLAEHMVAKVESTTTTAITRTSQDTSLKKQEMETKTPVSGTSTTLILSPTDILPKVGKDEVLTPLKSLQAQKCHSGHGLDEEAKQRRRMKRQSGCSASSGETIVVSTTTARKHARDSKEGKHGDESLARMLLEQQYRHQVEIEQIKQQCVALYRASLTEVRAEMKGKLARMKKTPVPSFHT
ncbi:hypothetical protein MVEG_03142 [Podila verticillata NRRL 6337]|nr:hypothetical protein MVEG_03142 [Podila verticillata NRRL 6337]